MKYLVKDHPGLFRDPISKAIINENQKAFDKYMREKQLRDKNIHFENEINNMKSDIIEIKNILRELLNKQA
ncbi:MAG: hypothetical protein ACO3UU_15850 [Minisyncoccia bacterium]